MHGDGDAHQLQRCHRYVPKSAIQYDVLVPVLLLVRDISTELTHQDLGDPPARQLGHRQLRRRNPSQRKQQHRGQQRPLLQR